MILIDHYFLTPLEDERVREKEKIQNRLKSVFSVV